MENEKDITGVMIRTALGTIALGSLLTACDKNTAQAAEKALATNAPVTETIDEGTLAAMTAEKTEIPSVVVTETVIIEPSVMVTAAETPTEFPTAVSLESEISQEEIDFLASHEFNTGDRSRQVIMMTYDDGGSTYGIERVMTTAEKYSGKVTFFVPGTWLEENPDLAKEIVARGHLLECHGWDHTDMSTMTEGGVRKQIADFLATAKEILPDYEVKYIRFPFGARNAMDRKIAAEFGLQSVMWGVESGGKDADASYNNVVDRAYWGSVVLSHTTREPDVDAVTKIFKELADEGYKFETVETGRAANQVWVGGK